MTRRVLGLLCAATLAVLLAGCGGPDNTQLVGTWRPFEVDKKVVNVPGHPSVQPIAFAEDGTWKASNGCDVLTGSYDLEVDGTFSGEKNAGAAAPCANENDVTAILGRADRVTFTQCSAIFERDGQRLLVASLNDCEGDSILGGGLPSSG